MNGAAGSQIILASASPRRRDLLSQIGVSHRVIASAVEEKVLEGENAGDFVCRMAREKASVASGESYICALGVGSLRAE